MNRRSPSHRLLRCSVAVASMALLLARPATAQVPVTLTGEVLAATGPPVEVTCTGSLASFAISFRAEGVAVGPYPGTFTETGTHVGPGLEVVEVSFRIVSDTTTITGTKRYDGAALATSGCSEFTRPFTTGVLRYEARIETPTGVFIDRGSALTHAQSLQEDPPLGQFDESFVSDLEAPLPATPTRPGKGCGDKKHTHADEATCKKPAK